ncbi:hypothetical protein [Bacillus wiedmannii]|uniref:hypothetical protein n=1 Tax=Bacillus wiedmannii TaxID=1890302 RepID=UPI003D232A17
MTNYKQIITNPFGAYDDRKDGYPQFEDSLKVSFEEAIDGGQKLFTTNLENLYETYLCHLPQESRQNYSCNECRRFINRFGGLVTIDAEGNAQSAMWDVEAVPPFFKRAVLAMKNLVESSTVNGVFLSEETRLGTPKTGKWTHLSVDMPRHMQFRDMLKTAGQAMAQKREEKNMLINALTSYTLEDVEQALALIQSETMYRADKVYDIARWFKKVMVERENGATAMQKRNIVWKAVATAPTGFTHIRSGMLGTLLDDIQDGLSARVISARFAEKMNPENHMRSQSAPTANAIFEAEKIVAKLGIEPSLQRRYARFGELPHFLWMNNDTVNRLKGEQARGGVFGHLTPREKTQSNVMTLPTSVMTWEKFQRTVMPTADKMEVLVDNPNRLMALVTAMDKTAPNILRWDNTFSWYYHGGIDGEMKRRVEDAGGRYENNAMRCSLLWEGLTDLDLHCITPSGEHIMYNHKRGRCGGYLDLDMNGIDKSSEKPVENMRWSQNVPEGRYRFYVNNFNERVNHRQGTPFRVELEIHGQVYHYEGQALAENRDVTVFEFDYVRGQQPNIQGNSYSSNDSWSIGTGEFVKVNGITTSPNLWEEKQITGAGTHVFFLLDGMKDMSEGKGRGFFNEMLKADLRQIRKTLEAFTANTPIEGGDKADACGVGYSKDTEWDLTVKVTTGNSTRIIKIDRWD